jgi:hypothetical protein
MDGRPVETFDLLKCSFWKVTLHSSWITPTQSASTFNIPSTCTSLYLPHVPFDFLSSAVVICEIP